MYDIELSPLERKFLTFRRWIHPHLYRLKFIGKVMSIFAVLGPLLIVIHVLPNTMFINVVVYLSLLIGPIFYLIGRAYDSGFVRAP